MTGQVNIKNETIYEDGGYSALVSLYGQEFAISYSNREIKVFSTAGASTYDPRPRWQRQSTGTAVRNWAADRIAAQSPAWHAAHDALYAA